LASCDALDIHSYDILLCSLSTLAEAPYSSGCAFERGVKQKISSKFQQKLYKNNNIIPFIFIEVVLNYSAVRQLQGAY